jgi:hypothetical protein
LAYIIHEIESKIIRRQLLSVGKCGSYVSVFWGQERCLTTFFHLRPRLAKEATSGAKYSSYMCLATKTTLATTRYNYIGPETH